MKFVAERKHEDEAGCEQFRLKAHPRIYAECSPRKESKNRVLRDVTRLADNRMPEYELRNRHGGKQELQDRLNKDGGVGTGERIGREKENHDHPRGQGEPGSAFSIR